MVRAQGFAVVGAIVLALGGCGHSGPAGTDQTASRPVPVSGVVTRSCVGPLIRGQPRRCQARAVFEGRGRRTTVRGRFSIRLLPGTYRISVDTCADQQTLRLSRPIAGLRLVPRCAVPM